MRLVESLGLGILLQNSGHRLADFTDEQLNSISSQIGENTKAGLPRNEAVALAIDRATNTVNYRNVVDTSAPKPEIPGGAFTAKQNRDGSWNIENVPIFAEHTVEVQVKNDKGRLEARDMKIDRDWMVAAMSKAVKRFKEDQYLPPLHIHHHMFGKETQPAGFFKIKAVRQEKLEGKDTWITFADLIQVPSDLYELVRAAKLPYRSVEIHDVTSPEIDSLALLDDEVPFFRFKLLTIGKEVPQDMPNEIGPITRNAYREHAVRAYQRVGSGARILMYMGDFKMDPVTQKALNSLGFSDDALALSDDAAKKKVADNPESEEKKKVAAQDEDKDEKKEEKAQDDEDKKKVAEKAQDDEDEKKKVATQADNGDDDKDKEKKSEQNSAENVLRAAVEAFNSIAQISAKTAEMLAQAAGGNPQDNREEDKKPKSESPAPVETSNQAVQHREDGSAMVEYAATTTEGRRIAQLEGKVDGLVFTNALERKVRDAAATGATYGLSEDTLKAKLYQIGKDRGLEAIDVYMDGVKESMDVDPPHGWTGDMPKTATIKKELASYAKYGDNALELAAKYDAEYEEFTSRGMKFEYSKKQFIDDQLRSDGIDIPQGQED